MKVAHETDLLPEKIGSKNSNCPNTICGGLISGKSTSADVKGLAKPVLVVSSRIAPTHTHDNFVESKFI
jgi:hypothetical protein